MTAVSFYLLLRQLYRLDDEAFRTLSIDGIGCPARDAQHLGDRCDRLRENLDVRIGSSVVLRAQPLQKRLVSQLVAKVSAQEFELARLLVKVGWIVLIPRPA